MDIASTPVDGADVTTDLHGVTVEVFNFDAPLTALPGLQGRTRDRLLLASAINLRNPNLMFGADPFGFGTGSHATRFTAMLEPVAGRHRAHVHARRQRRWQVVRQRHPVVDLPASTGQFQQASGTIDPGVDDPIEILAFDNGNPEVQLLVAAPEYDVEVPEPDAHADDRSIHRNVASGRHVRCWRRSDGPG